MLAPTLVIAEPTRNPSRPIDCRRGATAALVERQDAPHARTPPVVLGERRTAGGGPRHPYCENAGRELDGVAAVQRLLLPGSPPSIPGYDVAVAYRPLGRSGGDYYDFLPLPDGRIGLLVADVNGHGAPAAVGMAMLCATVRAAPDRAHPARLMEWVNGQLAGGYASGQGNFATAFYAVLDPPARTLAYASAGHHPPLLWSSAGWRPLDRAQRLPLGVIAGERFVEGRADLDPGGALALFTDGITEIRDAAGQMFGPERLARIPRQPADPAEVTAARIEDAVRTFAGGRRAADDQTLVVMTALH